MKIKKVDDKPLVIHTKQKAKLHTHEPKQASIKGSNIYNVDRDPTKKNKDNGDSRKSTVHQVPKEGLISRYRKNAKESNQSIKVKNHSLRSVGMAGGKAMTDQMEGGQELQQASMIMYEATKPVTGTASRGADLFKRHGTTTATTTSYLYVNVTLKSCYTQAEDYGFTQEQLDAGVDISYGGASTAGYEAQGLAEAGKTVVYEEMKQGDLIFFSYEETDGYLDISHVGMYVGNGKMVDARGTAYGVVYRDVPNNGAIVMIGRPD